MLSCTLYPYAVLEALTESIENDDLKMTRFLEQQNARYIQYDESFKHQFLNINTLENFRNAELIMNQRIIF